MLGSPARPRIVVSILVAALVGCGEDRGSTYVFVDASTHDGPIVRVDGQRDLGEEPDFVDSAIGAPVIAIQYPAEGQTIVGDVMTVRASITDEEGVDDQSVKLTVQGVVTSVSMGVTATPNIYEALVDVKGLSGKSRVWVTASDLLGNAATSQPVEFERDPGPTIIFLSPVAESRHKSSTSVQVAVADTKTVTSFKVTIGNTELTMTETASAPDRKVYAGTVVFDDPIWGPPLSGRQVVTATATNQNGATTSAQRAFIIDRSGPSISITSHAAGTLIGGVIQIQATASDPAGVVASSVKAIIGNDLVNRLVPLSPVAGSPGQYEGTFDTRTLARNDLFPVLSVRAADQLGNESHVDFEVWLDNGQPILSLDPPRNVALREKNKVLECSRSFDPVGDDAASDGEEVPQIAMIRARVEDQGNGSVVTSAKWVPLAGINTSSITLYILDDTSIPLVIDTTGDGYCDAINPAVIPAAGTPLPGQAVAVRLAAINPVGVPDYTPSMEVLPGSCGPGSESDPPPALCRNVRAPAPDDPLWHNYTVARSYAGGQPAIYALQPIRASDPNLCAGMPFDFKANNFQRGWVCLAAIASDTLGLTGVSKPMRLFYNETLGGYVKGILSTDPMPDCTGTQDSSGVITNTPCKFRQQGEDFPQTYTYNSSSVLEIWDQR